MPHIPMTYPRRMLTSAGYNREQIIELGGVFIDAGESNVEFTQDAPGFAIVAQRMSQPLVEEPKTRSCAMRTKGPPLWKLMHTGALAKTENFPKLVSDIVESIKGTGCYKHAAAYIASNPPPNTTPDECFEWSWRFHDSVSDRIGAKRITLEEAKVICSRQTS